MLSLQGFSAETITNLNIDNSKLKGLIKSFSGDNSLVLMKDVVINNDYQDITDEVLGALNIGVDNTPRVPEVKKIEAPFAKKPNKKQIKEKNRYLEMIP
jgi:hypothetical protein